MASSSGQNAQFVAPQQPAQPQSSQQTTTTTTTSSSQTTKLVETEKIDQLLTVYTKKIVSAHTTYENVTLELNKFINSGDMFETTATNSLFSVMMKHHAKVIPNKARNLLLQQRQELFGNLRKLSTETVKNMRQLLTDYSKKLVLESEKFYTVKQEEITKEFTQGLPLEMQPTMQAKLKQSTSQYLLDKKIALKIQQSKNFNEKRAERKQKQKLKSVTQGETPDLDMDSTTESGKNELVELVHQLQNELYSMKQTMSNNMTHKNQSPKSRSSSRQARSRSRSRTRMNQRTNSPSQFSRSQVRETQTSQSPKRKRNNSRMGQKRNNYQSNQQRNPSNNNRQRNYSRSRTRKHGENNGGNNSRPRNRSRSRSPKRQ